MTDQTTDAAVEQRKDGPTGDGNWYYIDMYRLIHGKRTSMEWARAASQFLEREILAERQRAERAERYRRAIEDELIISHIFTEELAADPRRAIAAIIDWNCKIALDPSVSEAARALQQSGAEQAEKLLAEMRELSAKALSVATEANLEVAELAKHLATLRAPGQPAGGT